MGRRLLKATACFLVLCFAFTQVTWAMGSVVPSPAQAQNPSLILPFSNPQPLKAQQSAFLSLESLLDQSVIASPGGAWQSDLSPAVILRRDGLDPLDRDIFLTFLLINSKN